MLQPSPRHFMPSSALPGAGLPGDRMARLAARKAFVELNKRIAPELMQQVALIEDPSRLADTIGVHLALKLAPYAQLIATMRLPREPKYRLLCRFAVKLAMIAGAVEPGPIGEPRLVFGTALPGDKAGAVDVVTAALDAGAISTLTAVQLLIAAGFPIVDAAEEVARIRSEQTAKARELADATGSEALAAQWLGVDLPEADATPPTIELAP